MADYIYYPAIALTGGTDDALDGYDGNALNDKDVAIVVTATAFYHYILDDDSGAAESSPDVIKPDDNAGTKRWILVGVGGSSAPTAHHDSHDPEDGSDALDCAAPSELASVQASAEGSSHSLARSDHTHQIQHSIADNHVVTVDGTTNQPVTTDYAKFTASGLEGKDKVGMLSDLNVTDGADVTGDNAPQAHKDSHDPEDGSDKLDTAAPAELAAVQAAGVGSSHSLARADHAHQVQAAITDNHLVTVDGTTNQPVTTDYAKFTAEGLEGKDKAGVLSDLNVEDGADITDAVNIASSIVGVADKATPVDADSIALVDSAAASVLKETTWSNIKATLKTYFDTLYNKYVHPNHTGEVTSVADGATEIAAKAVTLAKMADMATASIIGRNTAAVGVPEVLAKATVLSILNVEDGADKVATVGIVADMTPQLGGDLDMNAKGIDFPSTANITDVKDEDNMVSDSATMLATQQSIKKYVDDNLGGGFSSRASVYRSTVQAIPSATLTKVEFNTETYDGLGEFDSTTNYRFTANTAGYYTVKAAVSISSLTDTDYVAVLIYKNGTSIAYSKRFLSDAGTGAGSVSKDIYLAATNYIEIHVYHPNAGAKNILEGDQYTFLTVHRLS